MLPVRRLSTLIAVVASASALLLTSASAAQAGTPPSCISWENHSNGPVPGTILVTSQCERWTLRLKIVVPWGPDSSCFDMKPLTSKGFNVPSVIGGKAVVATC